MFSENIWVFCNLPSILIIPFLSKNKKNYTMKIIWMLVAATFRYNNSVGKVSSWVRRSNVLYFICANLAIIKFSIFLSFLECLLSLYALISNKSNTISYGTKQMHMVRISLSKYIFLLKAIFTIFSSGSIIGLFIEKNHSFVFAANQMGSNYYKKLVCRDWGLALWDKKWTWLLGEIMWCLMIAYILFL